MCCRAKVVSQTAIKEVAKIELDFTSACVQSVRSDKEHGSVPVQHDKLSSQIK